MRTLLNAQLALLDHSLATGATAAASSPPSTSSSSSYAVPPPMFDPYRNLQLPGIPVSSSLALSTSLLQAAGSLEALSYLQRTKTGTHSPASVTQSAHVQSPKNFDVSKRNCNDHNSRRARQSHGTKTSGIGEDFGEEMPSESRKYPSPHEHDDFNRKNVEDTALNLEKIEHRAKASIEKLRHILLRVKTRSPKDSSSPTESPRATCEDGQEQTIETSNGGIIQNNTCCGTPPPSLGVGQNGNETNLEKSTPNGQEIRAPALQNPYDTQYDAVTYTKSTVKFNKDTNTGIVTLVATVKGDVLDPSEYMKEKTIILAAQALSCVCASLEAKASSLSSPQSTTETDGCSTRMRPWRMPSSSLTTPRTPTATPPPRPTGSHTN
ncbi:uncharacterized protein [Physcomitrium patens]|uniref:uncharacterized protein isoform X2 n=1 Tax=Physcomitrium patens TaxID=3218 RepID=UPI003CCDF69A